MSSHDPIRTASRGSLSALVAQLRESCDAVARFQGGHTSYREELAIFKEQARAQGLFIDKAPPELNTPPDEEGNEHQVWYQKEEARFLKATWPDHFGMLVIYRHDEDPQASPVAYLERWHLHNQLFGDDVEFLGALDTPNGLRMLISQPAIEGSPATSQEIDQFFIESGWRKFKISGDVAYFDPAQRLVISDTHRGNIILMKNGMFAPIDLRVQSLTGSLLDSVRKLTHSCL